MGRIKTQLSKRVTLELYKKHNDRFSKDFENNKKIVKNLSTLSSKKQVNVVAGYITRLLKGEKKLLIN
ncbi:MAG: 30S ribosomal protein S17e [Nanoarchaeota archaeon]